MLVRVPIKQEDRGTVVAYINPEHLAGLFSDASRGCTFKLAGADKYYMSDETTADFLKRFAPFQLAENIFGDVADKALWDQETARVHATATADDVSAAATQAATKLMEEAHKAHQTVIYDEFYADTPDKAREKMQSRFTDIVAGAIHSIISAGRGRTPDQD